MAPRSTASYLEGGTIAADHVRELFEAAAALYRLSPWRVAADDQVIAVDVPALRIHDACLTVIGSLGESTGFLLFDSHASYEAFSAGDVPDTSGFLLSLNFEPGDVLPPSMRREVAAHGWPIAGPEAYPVVLCLDDDGERRSSTPADIAVATVCAGVLAPFFERHGDAFRSRSATFASEELTSASDLLARVRWPHPDTGAAVTQLRVTPDAPCLCGSGRTFGGCHLRLDGSSPIRAMKRAHYAAWPDLPLPALGGRRPRRVVQTPEGRAAVAHVVAGIAALEQDAPEGERFDVSALRRALGLDG